MPFDYRKLLGRMTEKYGTQAEFAKAMGVSERTLSLKLNGKIGWKQVEIVKACELLSIENADICAYFFALKVQ